MKLVVWISIKRIREAILPRCSYGWSGCCGFRLGTALRIPYLSASRGLVFRADGRAFGATRDGVAPLTRSWEGSEGAATIKGDEESNAFGIHPCGCKETLSVEMMGIG
jgi:hypothetical protein